jgi:hypothetical protein
MKTLIKEPESFMPKELKYMKLNNRMILPWKLS